MIARLCEPLGGGVRVVWARELGEDYGAMVEWPGIAWIVISERLATDPAEMRDTVAHEIAHVAAYREHGSDIEPHGPEWRRAHRHFLALLP